MNGAHAHRTAHVPPSFSELGSMLARVNATLQCYTVVLLITICQLCRIIKCSPHSSSSSSQVSTPRREGREGRRERLKRHSQYLRIAPIQQTDGRTAVSDASRRGRKREREGREVRRKELTSLEEKICRMGQIWLRINEKGIGG